MTISTHAFGRTDALVLVAKAVLLLFGLSVPTAAAASFETHEIELMPPPDSAFHDQMGGWPEEFTPATFHAARGEFTIHAHDDGRTDLVFDVRGLLPYGVYTLWDVVDPRFETFKDRPLANRPEGVDPDQDHWWQEVALGPNGGPDGFGRWGFQADADGRARVVVNLDHRPGAEFLLDYHADGKVRGGRKGVTVFPGVLWAKFPDWDETSPTN